MAKRDVQMRVTARHLRKEQVSVTLSNHQIISDHPARYNGDDQGPTPAELILGGLAACTAVNVARYAERKGYPLESIEVRTGFALDGEKVEDAPLHVLSYISDIASFVDMKGDLTPAQYAELKWIAEHCPIGETLRRGVDVAEHVSLNGDPEPK